jgi:hypothetical protein
LAFLFGRVGQLLHHVGIASGARQQDETAEILRSMQTVLSQIKLTLFRGYLGQKFPLLFTLKLKIINLIKLKINSIDSLFNGHKNGHLMY